MPFVTAVVNDVVPMIDKTYRTIPDSKHRAMAGLSLGGTQTYQITQTNLDKFAYIGISARHLVFLALRRDTMAC